MKKIKTQNLKSQTQNPIVLFPRLNPESLYLKTLSNEISLCSQNRSHLSLKPLSRVPFAYPPLNIVKQQKRKSTVSQRPQAEISPSVTTTNQVLKSSASSLPILVP